MLGDMSTAPQNYHKVPDAVVDRYRTLLNRKARPGSENEGRIVDKLLSKMRASHPGVEIRAAMPPVDLDDLGLSGEPPPPPGATFHAGRPGFWGGVANFARGVFDALSIQQAAADLTDNTVSMNVKRTATGLRVTVDIDTNGIVAAQSWGEEGVYAYIESIGAGVTVEIINAIE